MKNIYNYKLVKENTYKLDESKRILNSQDIYDFLMEYAFNDGTIEIQESFYVVFLNNNNIVKGFYKAHSGGINFVMVDPRIVYSAALNCLASAICVAHNHPSGNIAPSDEDKRVTERLKQCGDMLNIRLLDHIIVAPEKGKYYSFNDSEQIELKENYWNTTKWRK